MSIKCCCLYGKWQYVPQRAVRDTISSLGVPLSKLNTCENSRIQRVLQRGCHKSSKWTLNQNKEKRSNERTTFNACFSASKKKKFINRFEIKLFKLHLVYKCNTPLHNINDIMKISKRYNNLKIVSIPPL